MDIKEVGGECLDIQTQLIWERLRDQSDLVLERVTFSSEREWDTPRLRRRRWTVVLDNSWNWWSPWGTQIELNLYKILSFNRLLQNSSSSCEVVEFCQDELIYAKFWHSAYSSLKEKNNRWDCTNTINPTMDGFNRKFTV